MRSLSLGGFGSLLPLISSLARTTFSLKPEVAALYLSIPVGAVAEPARGRYRRNFAWTLDWPLRTVPGCLLERMRELQHAPIGAMPSHDLQTNGQSSHGESRGD